jgi:hypothetical protein
MGLEGLTACCAIPAPAAAAPAAVTVEILKKSLRSI